MFNMLSHSARRLIYLAVLLLLGFALLRTPTSALAGQYEDTLAALESIYGSIGDTNDAAPGSVDWQVIQLILIAKQLHADGDDAGALAKLLEAEAIVQSIK